VVVVVAAPMAVVAVVLVVYSMDHLQQLLVVFILSQ
jgi:hypothetical protein